MKKNLMILVAVVIVVIVGIVLISMHKSSKTSMYGSTTSTSSTSSSAKSQTVAVNNAVLKTMTSSSLGQYLATPTGYALYTYSGDSIGVSNCSGACLATWPAYQDKGSTSGLPANVSTIKRTDNGQIQYTYKGFPLYTFVSDSQGQVTGNGEANFQVAKP